MIRRGVFLALAVAFAAGCSDANLAEPEGLGIQAARYLDQAVDVMEFNSIRRFEIDWVAFREATMEDAGNAKTLADTYPAIRRALDRIGDHHSFFQPPGGAPALGSSSPAAAAPALVDPSVALVEPEIGYLDVPAYSGGGAEGDALAALYHGLIESVDTTGVCGWVVDLRGNTGGNMWPMLAGVGPILGTGVAGSFVYPDSVVQPWSYVGGKASLAGSPLATADPFYAPADPPRPVAVLTDARTASSGEGVTVAFRGRPETRSFGLSTFGVSTGNAGYQLIDGAIIFLTVAWMADRDGEVYGTELPPDEVVTGAKTGVRATDPVLDRALEWLETGSCPPV